AQRESQARANLPIILVVRGKRLSASLVVSHGELLHVGGLPQEEIGERAAGVLAVEREHGVVVVRRGPVVGGPAILAAELQNMAAVAITQVVFQLNDGAVVGLVRIL